MTQRFHYNSATCRYEPIDGSAANIISKKVIRVLAFSFLIAVVLLIGYNKFYPSIDETAQLEKNKKLKTEWQALNLQLEKTSQALTDLEKSDDQNFRVILGLEPLSAAQREAGTGGREKLTDNIENSIVRSALNLSAKIKNRLTVEVHSLEELKNTFALRQKQWASRPAIQPINNKELTKLYLVFGKRMHPILGIVRPHNGLDFVAPYRSSIYATGDGVVEYANRMSTYGKVVFINHGYGFKTHYAHMAQYIVSVGQHVKRGQIIGYVGNTGLSAGSHLHYEVLYNNKFVNPIGFFQRDLTNKEYEKLIEHGHDHDAALD